MISVRKGLLISGFIVWILAAFIFILPIVLGILYAGVIGGFFGGLFSFLSLIIVVPLAIVGFIIVLLGAVLSSQEQKLEIARAQSGQHNQALNELNSKLINDQISEEEFKRKRDIILGYENTSAIAAKRNLAKYPHLLTRLRRDRQFLAEVIASVILVVVVFFAVSIFVVPVHVTKVEVRISTIISGLQNTIPPRPNGPQINLTFDGFSVHSFGFVTEHLTIQNNLSIISNLSIQSISITTAGFHVWSITPHLPSSLSYNELVKVAIEFSCPYSYTGPLNVHVIGAYS